ncbi:MAG: thiamine pyrophosphate-dependent enzyme [Candidatus Shapirobacteria bacterium]|nr:thiamine pyrophosphate-dependent enzyme [Candidatus Shapirobacteria bacterium]
MTNYRSNITPTFCPGCHNFSVYAAMQSAFNALNLKTSDLVINFDIGCVGNMADFFKTYAVHTLHGRSITTAMGEKLANPNLTVCAIGGDGGIYGEGLNHLIAAARANIDITVFVSNNFLYSLTTGQTSPTTPKGARTKSTPLGNVSEPLDIVKVLKSVNSNIFVKSVDAKDIQDVTKNFKEALEFKGFSIVETRQECVAFGKQLKS